MAVKKITKRWLFNNLGVILVILLALEVAFAIGVRGFFCSQRRSRASTPRPTILPPCSKAIQRTAR